MDGDLLSDLPVPAPAPAPGRGAVSLALYDSMCRAIDAAFAVDEVKDIRDQALAFEVYARQAKNIDAERRACEIRLRAERKAGELDKVRDKPKGSPGNQYTGPLPPGNGSNSPPTLRDLGVSAKQAHTWRKLHDVPEEQFEEALAADTKPTTTGIIASAKPEPEVVPVSKEALWLWGRLRDFERDGLFDRPPADVLLTMTAEMLDDTHRLAPRVAHWLSQIGAADG